MDFVRVQADPIACNGLPESCTSRSDVTNTVGAYEIGESATGTFQLTATRDDVVATATPVTVTAPIPTQVDLVVRYRISGSLLRSALSTATGQASTPLTITSYAPLPGAPGQTGGASCVKVTDSRTGTTLDATLTGSDSRTSTWSYTLSAPQGTTEGTYRLSFEADDCTNGTALSIVSSADYIIDNTAPEVLFLSPTHEGNSLYDVFPLTASVKDRRDQIGLGSGIDSLDPLALSVEVQDALHVDPLLRPTIQFSYGIVRANLTGLRRGAQYDATVAAIDRAGNSASRTIRFGVMNSVTTPTPGQVRVATTSSLPATFSQPGGALDPSDTYYWDTIPIQVDPFIVTLDGNFHVGNGTVLVSIPLDMLRIEYTVAGQPFTLNTQLFPPTGSTRVAVAFGVDSLGLTTVTVPAQTGYLWRVAAALPKGIDSGSARLSLNDYASALNFSVCTDPLASTDVRCSVDPAPTIVGIGLSLPICVPIAGSNDDSDVTSLPGSDACYSPATPDVLSEAHTTATPPDLDDNDTTANFGPPSDPRRRYLGVRVKDGLQLRSRGVGARLQVSNPTVGHQSRCQVPGSNPPRFKIDFFASRAMMKTPNLSGEAGYRSYDWMEAGWTEHGNDFVDRALVYRYWFVYGGPATPMLLEPEYHPQYRIERDRGYLFFVRHDEAANRNNYWLGFIYFGGRWNQLGDPQALNFTLGIEPEAQWEIYQPCTNQDISPGVGYMGYDTEWRAIRVRAEDGNLRIWSSGNYPSFAAGGPTATCSLAACIGNTSQNCYDLTWNHTWYYSKIFKP